ncbi:translation initiation factor IF-2 [Sunxiuqinia elliptica]|uniref:Translation initiation factor IF-2 n=1 Tax=Sunxiuqinia elliptica TaxID=655355 RepID=A0A4R6H7F3_9BACT|nr:translation initiation factor IF-2 [Sunxiuqinia elliptica]TDO03405.1 translation initiation factor 2 (bIF-2) [Sunxiuqinia elliptica]TDO59601.1 translation initiation factor 2 (bIF-2) [Sunxiuqinia elliptica]
MAIGKKNTRLSKVAREFNVGISTIVDFLHKKGFDIDSNPNSKISEDAYHMLEKEYKSDISLKKESEKINLMSHRSKNESISLDQPETASDDTEQDDNDGEDEVEEVRIKDMNVPKKEVPKPKPEPKPQPKEENESLPEVEKPRVVGKIDLDSVQPKKREGKPTVIKKADLKQQEAEKPKAVEPEKEKEVTKPKETEPEKPEAVTPKKEEKVKEETPKKAEEPQDVQTNIPKVDEVKVVGKIDLSSINQKTRPTKKTKKQKEEERKEREKQKRHSQHKGQDKDIKTNVNKLSGPNVVGKIEVNKNPGGSSNDNSAAKKKRRRIQKDSSPRVNVEKKQGQQRGRMQQQGGKGKRRIIKKEVSEEDVQKQIKDTLARLTSGKQKSKGAKYRRDKRQAASEKAAAEFEKQSAEKSILKVTEFVSVSELATMMDVSVTEIISSCMSLGLFVSINQRLDAETMSIVAEEFGYTVEFVSADIMEGVEEDDEPDEVHPRAPIVTVMGHVDHGKTSLLDYIRSANVIAGEAGGITQHIGAYHVSLEDGRKITFLDTPGHEAFTAMRARGAQVTDIAIIIVAADDDIMPQTKEAINHAQAAGVPIVFAINKIDKPGANPEKIKEGLANLNFLVEEWGGKYQSQDISAKQGLNISELLEKVVLEAEMLELKGNKDKRASGTIVESSLDKGRGYVATVLVQNGTLRQGDIVLAGQYYGHIKAMFNERNQRIDSAGPSEPVIILGLDGAPQAGDKFNVFENEREARQIANKREQLAREQGLRTQKHITLDEIGRRIAIGNFQELNLIVKGDVDGSIEALSDSLIKLSTEEIQVNVIHKAVGAISESDIMLATASDAIVVGFQVRPSLGARKLAEKEEVDIRLYSIIYDAINELRSAMEGMLSPEIKEEILGTAEVLETFKITKVGTIAGCIVRDGKIARSSKVRLIRDGIVIYTGTLGSLKRFKDDAKEVLKGYECGLNIDGYNDIKVGDMVEAFHEVEVAKSL